MTFQERRAAVLALLRDSIEHPSAYNPERALQHRRRWTLFNRLSVFFISPLDYAMLVDAVAAYDRLNPWQKMLVCEAMHQVASTSLRPKQSD